MRRRLTPRQRMVLRLLGACPGGVAPGYLTYILSGRYPRDSRGRLGVVLSRLCRRGLVRSVFDFTHRQYFLTSRGVELVHAWLVRAKKRSLREKRTTGA